MSHGVTLCRSATPPPVCAVSGPTTGIRPWIWAMDPGGFKRAFGARGGYPWRQWLLALVRPCLGTAIPTPRTECALTECLIDSAPRSGCWHMCLGDGFGR